MKLHPSVAGVFRNFIEACESELGIVLRIIQGFRSIEEQQRIYEQGRTLPGKIVTNATGGSSYHNYGLAIDLAVLKDDGKGIAWNYDMATLKPIAERFGIEWGGDWKTLKDRPHFQITLGYTVHQLLARVRQNNIDASGFVVV